MVSSFPADERREVLPCGGIRSRVSGFFVVVDPTAYVRVFRRTDGQDEVSPRSDRSPAAQPRVRGAVRFLLRVLVCAPVSIERDTFGARHHVPGRRLTTDVQRRSYRVVSPPRTRGMINGDDDGGGLLSRVSGPGTSPIGVS